MNTFRRMPWDPPRLPPAPEEFRCACRTHQGPNPLPVRERDWSGHSPADWCESCWAEWFWGLGRYGGKPGNGAHSAGRNRPCDCGHTAAWLKIFTGRTYKQVAAQTGLSVRTVQRYAKKILQFSA